MTDEAAKVTEVLKQLNIEFEYYEHPPVFTIDEARKYWNNQGIHCKNLFFRNHKGNQHYLISFHHEKNLPVQTIEQKIKQGKLSFASEQRMEKHLGIKPGAVSPFGLLNDTDKHVILFLDNDLKTAEYVSFHPNVNTATITISGNAFLIYLNWCGNKIEWIDV